MKDKGDCRTALATPGLLKICIYIVHTKLQLYHLSLMFVACFWQDSQIHRGSVYSDLGHVCFKCAITFKTEFHLATMTKDKTKLKQAHIKIMFSCTYCNKILMPKDNLRMHIQICAFTQTNETISIKWFYFLSFQSRQDLQNHKTEFIYVLWLKQ